MPATPYLEFQAAIFDTSKPADTTPANLSTITPGSGVFTPGNKDLLKSLAGHMVANGGWVLAAVLGSDPAVYVLTSIGSSGFDSMAMELSWSADRGAILTRMAQGYTGGALTNPSPYQAWPVSNGGAAGVNNLRVVSVYAYVDLDTLSLVTKESTAGYSTGVGPFGLIKRWPNVVPTSATLPSNADRTAIFMAIPTRVFSNTAPALMYTANNPTATNPGYMSASGGSISGPTLNGQGAPGLDLQLSSYAYGVAPTLYMTGVSNAILVCQHYGDNTTNWVVNHLGMTWDNDRVENSATEPLGATKYQSNIRQPMWQLPTLGTDGVFHMDREKIIQKVGTADTSPKTRGLLPGVIYAGPNAGSELTEITAGAEVYKRFNLNLGFWPKMNPNGFALRKA